MFVRYCGSYLIKDLEKLRLSVSKATDFNDPFELHLTPGPPLTRNQAKQSFETVKKRESFQRSIMRKKGLKTISQLKRHLRTHRQHYINTLIVRQPELIQTNRDQIWEVMDDSARVMCFAKVKDKDPVEIPMWGYYGSGHTGIRLHVSENFFKRDGRSTFEMVYSANPPVLDLSLDPLGEEYFEFSRKLLRYKSDAWKHEDETRLLIYPQKCVTEKDSNDHDREFVRISVSDITRIDLGVKFDAKRIDEALKLKNVYPDLEVYRATKSGSGYYIDYTKI